MAEPCATGPCAVTSWKRSRHWKPCYPKSDRTVQTRLMERRSADKVCRFGVKSNDWERSPGLSVRVAVSARFDIVGPGFRIVTGQVGHLFRRRGLRTGVFENVTPLRRRLVEQLVK